MSREYGQRPIVRQALAALDAFGCVDQVDAMAALGVWPRAAELRGDDTLAVIQAFPVRYGDGYGGHR